MSGDSTVVNTDLDCHLRLPSVPPLEAAVMSLIASPPPFFPLPRSGVMVEVERAACFVQAPLNAARGATVGSWQGRRDYNLK